MTPNPVPTLETLVLAVGMDARKQAVFRMAFKMHNKSLYRIVDGEEAQRAQLAIVDIDSPDGAEIWQRFRAAHPDLPALIVSVAPPAQAPAPVLQKPIRMESLFPQLEALRSGRVPAQKGGLSPAPATKLAETPHNPPVQPVAVTEPAEIAPTPREPTPVPAPPANLRPEEVNYFDPANGLLGLLHMVQRDRISAIIEGAGGKPLIVAHPGSNEVQLLAETSRIEELCRQDHGVCHARPPQPGDDLQAGARQPLDAFIWQVAIWTANGRLIRKLRLNTPVQLKHWPNLTRLAPIPGALRMAAFLTRAPVNPVLTSRMLQIPPRDLFNFLAATNSLELLLLPQTGPATAMAGTGRPNPEPAPQQAQPAPQKRGFLSRLLKKIAGI